jgi:hypothetical protein
MDIHIEPGQPLDLTLILPAAIFRQKFHALQRVIAPIADTPEAIEIRDHSIMAQLACLAPATADEITLATQYITATAGADRCFAQANQHADDFDLVMKASACSTASRPPARSATQTPSPPPRSPGPSTPPSASWPTPSGAPRQPRWPPRHPAPTKNPSTPTSE